MRLLLTCSTATGVHAGLELLEHEDDQAWFPYDTPGAVRRFLKRYRPAVGVIMETEVWPNMMARAQTLHVPMVLANARLSLKSQRWRRRRAMRSAFASSARTRSRSAATPSSISRRHPNCWCAAMSGARA